jgi:hypothetical protein
MPTYSIDPLHPDRLRCDRCGLAVAELTCPNVSNVEHLTARQVAEFFPEAAGEADIHEARCGRGERLCASA